MRRLTAVALFPLHLAGCTPGPKYKRPVFQPPANYYTEREVVQLSLADQTWWDLFKSSVRGGIVLCRCATGDPLRWDFQRI